MRQVRRGQTRQRLSREFLRQLKADAREAGAADGPTHLSHVVCQLIAQYDVHLVESNLDPGRIKQIVLTYPGICQRCGKEPEIGSRVWWQDNVGVWHDGCLMPPADAERLPLGLDGH